MSIDTDHIEMGCDTVDAFAIASACFEHMEGAWNAADGAASGEVFSDATEFVNIRGEHFRGDGVLIGDAHQGIFDTIYVGSTMRYVVDVARVVAPGCIVAVVTSTLDAPSGPLRGVNQSKITTVITEHGGRWSIVAFQNTLVLNIV
jgi:uncharacterized protein (TIGR02246 family)